MADDRLVYGIGFSFEEGVEEARKQAEKINADLSKLFSVDFSLNIDESSVKNFDSIISTLQNIDPVNSETSESIKALITELQELEIEIQKINELNKSLVESSNSAATNIESNTLQIAKAEQALSKAREASEKANLAAQKVETERAKTLQSESKAIIEQIKAEEKLEKAKSKTSQTKNEIDPRLIDEYKEKYDDLALTLEAVKVKYEELAQVSPSATLGLGVPELVESFKELDKSFVDDSSWTNLDNALRKINDTYTELIIKQEAYDEQLQKIKSSAQDYTDTQKDLGNNVKSVSDNFDESVSSIKSTSSQLSSAAKIASESFANLGQKAREDAELLVTYQNELAETKREIKELNNAYKSGQVSETEYIIRKAELTALQKDQTENVNEYNNILKANVQLITNEAGSYKALQAELKLTQIELKKLSADRNASIKDIERLQIKSRGLTEELERQRLAQGKYALTAGSYGQGVRDLTYAVRLLDPSLGILVQRTQRISVLNTLWNKTNLAIVKSLKVTAQAASKIMLGAIGLLAAGISGLVLWYKKWKEESDAIKEISHSISTSITSSLVSFQSYVSVLSSAAEGTNSWHTALQQLKSEHGEHLKRLGIEIRTTQDLIDNYDKLIELIVEEAQTKGLSAGIEQANKKFAEEWEKVTEQVVKVFEDEFGVEEGYKAAQDFLTGVYKANGELTEELQATYDKFSKKTLQFQGMFGGVKEIDTNALALPYNNGYYAIKRLSDSTNLLTQRSESLGKGIERINGLIEEQTKTVKDLREARELLTDEQALIANAKELDQAEILLKYYTELGRATKEQKKDSISLLKEELDLIGSAYDKYQDLIDSVGAFNAEKIVRETYKAIIPNDKFAFSIDQLRESYEEVIEKLRKFGVSEADILKLRVQIDDRVFKQTQKDLKKRFDDIENEINKQKVANTFFDKLLGATGDVNLATDLTISLTGKSIENLRQQLLTSIQDGFENFEVSVDITPDLNIQDIQKEIDKLPEEQRKSLQKLLDQLISYDQDAILSIYSNLSKYSEYEVKKTEIIRKGEEERKKILQYFAGEQQQELTTASLKKQEKELASLMFGEFKQGGLWQTTFENLEKAGKKTIDILIDRIQELLDTIGQDLPINEYKELVKTLEKLKGEKLNRSLFGSITESVKEYSIARKNLSIVESESNQIIAVTTSKIKQLNEELSAANTSDERRIEIQKELTKELEKRAKAEEAIAKAESKVSSAGANAANSVQNLSSKFQEIAQTAQRTNELIFELADALGLISEESKEAWNDIQTIISGQMEIAQGAGDFIGGLFKGDIASMVNGIGESVNGTLQTIIGFVNYFGNKKLRKINAQIKEQADIIKELRYEYGRLQKAQQSALGTDFAKNYAEQAENLRAEQEAIQKQIELEQQKKSKKQDNEQIKQWKDDIRDIQDAIDDLQGQFVQDLLETDIASAAKSFSDSWLDAYLSFSDTKDALVSDYKDLMKRLVVNTVLSQSIQSLVEGIFKDAGSLFDANYNLNQVALKKLVEGTEIFADKSNEILTAIADALDLRSLLGDTLDTTLQGLSKGVASLTEDTALTLGAYLGTIEYYTVAKYELLTDIFKFISTEGNLDINNNSVNDIMELQQSSLSELIQIRSNTEIIASHCSDIEDLFRSVRSARGVEASYGITISKK